MAVTQAKWGNTTYFAFEEPTPKKVPITRTIEDAIDRYRSYRLTDPDHIVLHPPQAEAVGPVYTHQRTNLKVDVVGDRIVALNTVYVGRFEEV